MRTTLDIADDVLQAAKELALVRGETTGQVLSALARKGLAVPAHRGSTRNGVPLLARRPANAPRPTMKLVNCFATSSAGATGMSRVALLDVNVLVALFDPDHVHHEFAHDWFADHRQQGWATCPITENGLVRVLSNPAYAGSTLRPAAVTSALARFRASGDHAFWPATLSLTDERVFDLSVASGHGKLTDVYLLGLASDDERVPGHVRSHDPRQRGTWRDGCELQVIGPA